MLKSSRLILALRLVFFSAFLVSAVASPGQAQLQTCETLANVTYPLVTAPPAPGDIVRVRISVGTGSISGGTQAEVREIRFALDCNGQAGFPCQDDGDVVAYQGDETFIEDCGIGWSSLQFGTRPNEVIFRPNRPLLIAANVPDFCGIEFDVKLLTPSNDSTPNTVEEISAIDATCNNGIDGSLQVTSALGEPEQGLPTCTGILEVSYPVQGQPVNPGDAVRVRIDFGTGNIVGGGRQLTINQVRFELDCAAETACVDEGAVVAYQGDQTILESCGIFWRTLHGPNPFPNEVTFIASPPLSIPADFRAYCFLEFDIKVLGHSTDTTPDVIEQAASLNVDEGDAACDNGLTPLTDQPSAIQLMPGDAVSFRSQRLFDPPRDTVTGFGNAVAGVGNDVLVGAPFDRKGAGAVYLFDSITSFTSVRQVLENPEPLTQKDFGVSVASLGSNILVGALGKNGNPGVVYLFDGTDLRKRPITFVQGPASGVASTFGQTLAVVDGGVVVGAPGDEAQSGVAYLFDGVSRAQIRSFANPAPEPGDRFGTALAPAGSDLLVGAPGADGGRGATFLFDPATGELLIPFENPSLSDDVATDFGRALAATESTILIGAPGTFGGYPRAYLFDAGTGELRRTIKSVVDEGFGSAIAAVGPNYIVGGPFSLTALLDGTTGGLLVRYGEKAQAVAAVGPNVVEGSGADATVFNAETGEIVRLLERPRSGSFFGAALGVLGNDEQPGDFVIGAPQQRDGSGAAYLFAAHSLQPGDSSPADVVYDPNSNIDDRFGAAVAAAGNTVLVGAPGDDTGTPDGGVAYLLTVSNLPSGEPNFEKPYRVIANPEPHVQDGFGFAVALTDSSAFVGAPFDDNDGAKDDAGAVYVFQTTTRQLVRILRAPGASVGAYFGTSIASLGADVLVGAPFDEAGAGAVYLFDGQTGDLRQTFHNPTPDYGDLFGSAIAALPSDGVIIGAPFDDHSPALTDAGTAYVFSVTTGQATRTLREPDARAGNQFGFSVAAVASRVLVGTPLREPEGTTVDSGAAYLFEGTRDAPVWTFAPFVGSRAQLGFAVLGVGPDVLLGAPRRGAALLYGCATACGPIGGGNARRFRAESLGGLASADEPLPLPDPELLARTCAGGYCDDFDPCTRDICGLGGCSYEPIPGCDFGCKGEDAMCRDLDACNGSEVCRACTGCFLHQWPCCARSEVTRCVGGTPLFDGTPCDGIGLSCDVAPMCNVGECRCVCPNCGDGDTCTDDECTASGACLHVRRLGYADLFCRETQPLPATCQGQRGLKRIYRTRKQAFRKIDRAADSHERRARKLLERARRMFEKAAKRTERRRRIPETCKQELAGQLHGAAEASRTLADSI